MNKKYNYDKEADSLFIYLKKGPEEAFEEIAPGISIELNKKGEMIGIEILNVSRLLTKKQEKERTTIPEKTRIPIRTKK